MSYVLSNDDFKYGNATIDETTSNSISFHNSYGSDGWIGIDKTFENRGYEKMHVKGVRGSTVDASYLHLYLGFNDQNNSRVQTSPFFPAASTNFEYTLDIPEGTTSIVYPYIDWAYGNFTITEWYLE